MFFIRKNLVAIIWMSAESTNDDESVPSEDPAPGLPKMPTASFA
jgi:hypothetical protein